MRKLLCAFSLSTAILLLQPSASATTLNFDDLTTGLVPLPSTYQGFSFSNFYVNTLSTAFPSGYVNGTVSPSSVIYNAYGLDASFSTADNSAFTLNDFYLTAAINNGLSVAITGSRNGATLFSNTFMVSTLSSTRELVDWAGIDTVSFSSSGGTIDPTAGLVYVPGTQFVLDNVRVNESPTPVMTGTPEPGTITLLGTGLAGLTVLRRRFPKRT